MKNSLFLLSVLVLTSCNQAQEKVGLTAILISNVNIVDVRSGTILRNHQVVIDSGKIERISKSVENKDHYTKTIDGNGKYLMPGLAEMHAHIPQPPTSKERTEDVLFLYLSNGITTIRGMLGDPSHLELRKKAETGEILSPRIFTSSPSLNGNSVGTKEEAEQKVIAYQKAGYDFLKIHPGIRLEVFDHIVETAHTVGIPFAGHVPVAVGIRHALESKYASIDHIDGFLEGLVPEYENVDPTGNGFFGYNFTPLADATKIMELAQLAKKNKVWIVSTQSLFTRWFSLESPEKLLAEPEMKYMPPETLKNWEKAKRQNMASENFNENQWRQFIAIRRKLLKELQDNGHGLLLGSDAPQIFNVPGFSIHHEMKAMADAGLSPLEIIRSGTLNPALYFGMENTFGEIKEGLDADLILIDSNPLEDLNALHEISGVMLRGKWLDRETIDKKLAVIAENL